MDVTGKSGEKLAGIFKRPGGFAELSEDEAAKLAMAGVDVHEPAAALAIARAFKRSNGRWSDLSSEDKGRLANAGVDLDNPSVSRAMAKLFKRPGGFSDPADPIEDRAAPSSGFVPVAKEKAPQQKQRMFKRGIAGDDGIEEEVLGPTNVAGRTESQEALVHQRNQERYFKRGNQTYDDHDDSDGEEGNNVTLRKCCHNPATCFPCI